MSFPDLAEADLVCIGYPSGLLWIEDAAEVSRYNALFHQAPVAGASRRDG